MTRVLALTVALAAAPGAGDWVRLEMRGTVAALSPTEHLLTVARDDRADPVVVRTVPRGTIVQVGESVRTDLTPVQPGDQVLVWGAEGPGLTTVAARVVVLGRRGPAVPSRAAPAAGLVRGVVIAAQGSVLTVLTDAGVARQVVLSASTRLSGGESVGRYDIVRVRGVANSDGSLVATQLVIEFSASRAARLYGRAIAPTSVGFFVAPAVFVNRLPATAIVGDGDRRTAGAVRPGHLVRAYGDRIVFRDTLIGFTARVLVLD